MQLADPSAVTAIQADVTVEDAVAEDCPFNPASTRARLQMFPPFFNNGASSGPGDASGDVRAGLQTVRDSQLGDVIEAFIYLCENPACDGSVLAGATFNTTWVPGVSNMGCPNHMTALTRFLAPLNFLKFAILPSLVRVDKPSEGVWLCFPS